jgi:hypothetical protein
MRNIIANSIGVWSAGRILLPTTFSELPQRIGQLWSLDLVRSLWPFTQLDQLNKVNVSDGSD